MGMMSALAISLAPNQTLRPTPNPLPRSVRPCPPLHGPRAGAATDPGGGPREGPRAAWGGAGCGGGICGEGGRLGGRPRRGGRARGEGSSADEPQRLLEQFVGSFVDPFGKPYAPRHVVE